LPLRSGLDGIAAFGRDIQDSRKKLHPSHSLDKTIHYALLSRLIELDGQLVAVHGHLLPTPSKVL
jgi:hypothetical protein